MPTKKAWAYILKKGMYSFFHDNYSEYAFDYIW